mmetsp:Transcript_2842/g.8516  ORF Transcript_2842/g.8516 Transcript_2842/m.8516 type:complete len:554 (-) Transcript_2842:2794-4455(-)
MAAPDLADYVSTLELADSAKFHHVLTEVGITSVSDLARLDAGDRTELVDAMKEAGCVLGDRSKAKKLISSEHIERWRTSGGKPAAAAAAAKTALPPVAPAATPAPFATKKKAVVGLRPPAAHTPARHGGVQLRRTAAPPSEHNPPVANWRDRRPVSWVPDSERVGVDVTDTVAMAKARALESVNEDGDGEVVAKAPITLPTAEMDAATRAALETERKVREEEAAAFRRAQHHRKDPIKLPTAEVTAEQRAELEAERAARAAAAEARSSGDRPPTVAPAGAPAARGGREAMAESAVAAAAAEKPVKEEAPAAKVEAPVVSKSAEPAKVVAPTPTVPTDNPPATTPQAVAPPKPTPAPEPVFDAKACMERSKKAYAAALERADAARTISEASTGKQYYCKREGGGQFAVQVDEHAEPIEDPRLFTGQGKFEYPDGGWYAGRWVDGKKHGPGVLYAGDGTLYRGEFKSDVMSGLMVCTTPDGEKCVSPFRFMPKFHHRSVSHRNHGTPYPRRHTHGDPFADTKACLPMAQCTGLELWSCPAVKSIKAFSRTVLCMA